MKLLRFLDEAYLMSEYKFGFELEAIYNDQINYEDLLPFFNKFFPGGEVDWDGSVHPDDEDSQTAFEYKSPVLSFTPINIKKTIDLLNSIKTNNIYTNYSCGFHVHISFPNITFFDQAWILINLAMDSKMQKVISKFKKYDFFSKEFANFKILREIYADIETRNYTEIVPELALVNTKYTILNPHKGLGTLEWRGPREFLEESLLSEIKEFFQLLYKFVKWIDTVLDRDKVGKIPKGLFFPEKIQQHNTQYGKKTSPISKLLNKIKGGENKKDNKYKKINTLFVKNPELKKLFTEESSLKAIDEINIEGSKIKIKGVNVHTLDLHFNYYNFENLVEFERIRIINGSIEKCNLVNCELIETTIIDANVNGGKVTKCGLTKSKVIEADIGISLIYDSNIVKSTIILGFDKTEIKNSTLENCKIKVVQIGQDPNAIDELDLKRFIFTKDNIIKGSIDIPILELLKIIYWEKNKILKFFSPGEILMLPKLMKFSKLVDIIYAYFKDKNALKKNGIKTKL